MSDERSIHARPYRRWPRAAVLLAVTIVIAGGMLTAAAGAGAQSVPACPWVGSSVPVATKVADVLGQMTLSQKLSMLGGNPSADTGYAGYVAGIPSLCIPALKLEDNSSGVGDGIGDITAFPDGEAAAATWDPQLVWQYGAAVGAEQVAKGTNVVLGPMINIMRDPRWGRNYETFSEDPYLTSAIGVAEVQGIQSQGVIAEVKHIGAYTQEYNRTNVNSVVSRRALEEIYQAPFEAVVQQGKAGAIMAAADYTNGVYDNADPLLLTTDAKTAWQFPGFVTSDWDGAHSVDAAAAGLDISMPAPGNFGAPLEQAVEAGTVPIAVVNDHVARILDEMFVHGLFEHPDTGTLSAPATTPAHVQLAQDVAEQSTVLLKDDDSSLPLNANTVKSIAIVGEAGSASPKAVGCGSGAVTPTNVVTPLQGIQSAVGSGVPVGYADGSDVSAAAQLAASSSVAIVFANDQECEQGGASYDDRTSLDIGGGQDQLIDAVAAANPNTIVVLDTGSPITMPWLSKVKAVVEAWYPGQTDGSAIAAVLFGDVDPSGHLTQTWPKDEAQMPTASPSSWGNATTDDFTEGIDVGYRWYEVHHFKPLFPFGYGLSYTTFAFTGEQVVRTGGPDDPSFRVSAIVENTGNRAGSEVAQLYVGDPRSTGEPPKQLESFSKVTLRPGGSARVTFDVAGANLRYWDKSSGGWAIAPGLYRFYVGDSYEHTPLEQAATLGTTSGSTAVTVAAPSILRPAQATSVRSTVTVGGNQTQAQVRVSLITPAGWQVTPTTPASFRNVQPGADLVTTWRVTPPAQDAARLEQLGASATVSAGPSSQTLTGFQQVQVPAVVTSTFSPATLLVTPGTTADATLDLTNQTGESESVAWQVGEQSGLNVTPAQGTVTLAPGATVPVTLAVSSTTNQGASYELDVSLDATVGAFTYQGDAFLPVIQAYAFLAQAFNNVGITDDSDTSPGNFDGAGNSYSAEALAAVGLTPGATVEHDNATLTWPSVAPGTADNVQVAGQTIEVGASGSELAFLVAGTHGVASGTGMITYTDGSTQPFTLTTDNWTVAPVGSTTGTPPTGGDDLLATSAHWNPSTSPDGDYELAVFGYTVPINPAKTVAYVALPATMGGGDGSGLQTAHIFAMTTGT
jgi:beta-glucosidase